MNHYMNAINLHRYNLTGYTLKPRDICWATPDCEWTLLQLFSAPFGHLARTIILYLIRLTEQLYKCQHFETVLRLRRLVVEGR